MISIRDKLVKNFLVVIITTILILNLLTVIFFKQYYYKNRETFLKNQIESSISFYKKYFSNQSLMDNIYNNIDVFWNNIDTQVEILDSNGKLLMDSMGIRDENILKTTDIEKAINGETGRWVGKIDYYKGNVMIVSHPIIIDNNIIGIMRIISPLKDIDATMRSLVVLFISISLVVIVIGIIMSLFMAKSIVEPINSITDIAKEMASGNLKIRSNNKQNKEITQLSSTLNYMAQEIQEREKLKNDFISSVSHELRTPLTAIKGWVVTLNNPETDKETLDLGLNIIESEADRLSNMVEELLDFSKLVTGIISINKTEINIKSFLKYVENYMAPRASIDGIDFKIKIDIKTNRAYFDIDKIKQVIINVLDNSFKFSEEEDIVTFTVKEDYSNIIFSVEDTGCGISEKDLPRVKEKFYKGENSKSKNGIGLSICDEIIKLHGGEFEIKSLLGHGTIVIIKIPKIKEDKKHE